MLSKGTVPFSFLAEYVLLCIKNYLKPYSEQNIYPQFTLTYKYNRKNIYLILLSKVSYM